MGTDCADTDFLVDDVHTAEAEGMGPEEVSAPPSPTPMGESTKLGIGAWEPGSRPDSPLELSSTLGFTAPKAHPPPPPRAPGRPYLLAHL
jgi:hypothetical protein